MQQKMFIILYHNTIIRCGSHEN